MDGHTLANERELVIDTVIRLTICNASPEVAHYKLLLVWIDIDTVPRIIRFAICGIDKSGKSHLDVVHAKCESLIMAIRHVD